MKNVDRICAAIRREYPGTVASRAFLGLFRHFPDGASIMESPSGPPVAVDVPRGHYVYAPDQTVISPTEYHVIVERLAPATGVMSAGEKARARAMSQAERHG